MSHRPLPIWAATTLDGTPPAPTVLVLGGFLTSPPLYRRLEAAAAGRGVPRTSSSRTCG